MDGEGNALAVYNARGTGQQRQPEIAFARSVPGGGWTLGTVAELEADDALSVPDLAMDGSGRAIAVWRQADGPVYRIQAAQYRDGQWSQAVSVSTGPAAKRGQQHGAGTLADRPVIAMTRGGRALVVWQQVRSVDGSPVPEISLWASRLEPAP